jgi:hypothetical protein
MLCVSQRAELQHSALADRSASFEPFDDQGYPFSLIVVSANRMKFGPGGGSRVQEVSRTDSLLIK